MADDLLLYIQGDSCLCLHSCTSHDLFHPLCVQCMARRLQKEKHSSFFDTGKSENTGRPVIHTMGDLFLYLAYRFELVIVNNCTAGRKASRREMLSSLNCLYPDFIED